MNFSQCCRRVLASLGVAVVLIVGAACNSRPSTSIATQTTTHTVAAASTRGPDIDLNCVMNHIQNPPEAFHYTFTDNSDNPWHEDAVVTPQNIDGTFTNNSTPVPQVFHGSPQQVSSNLMGIGRMATIFSTVHSTSAVVRDGTEEKNGYQATKFSIDTARGTASENALFKTILGPGGSEKGTVWVNPDGCPVQILLDEEMYGRDGNSIGKAHYEEAMIKK